MNGPPDGEADEEESTRKKLTSWSKVKRWRSQRLFQLSPSPRLGLRTVTVFTAERRRTASSVRDGAGTAAQPHDPGRAPHAAVRTAIWRLFSLRPILDLREPDPACFIPQNAL
jgi:hypothetical protein